MPKFSIIIPEYKSGDKIQPAIESLQRQSFKEFEVIIIDDCSPDDSFEKIDNFLRATELNSKLIKANTNGGPGVARNIGLSNADGQYICFMDADDYISDDYFETLNGIITDSNADLIYFGNYFVIGNNKQINLPIHFPDRDSFVALASGSLWKFCFKRELLDKYPLPPIRNAEDIAVIPLIIANADKIVYCDKPMYYYIYNNDSLSSTHSPDVPHNFVKSFDYTMLHLVPPYSQGIEFHGIKTIIYGGVFNGLNAKMKWHEIKPLIQRFEERFPKWSENKYIKKYSYRKRLFLQLIRLRCYPLLKLYVAVHNLLLKYL